MVASRVPTLALAASVCLLLGGQAEARSEAESFAAASKCAAAMRSLATVEPASRAAVLATGCSDLYVEPRCRAAWTKFDVPPSQRLMFIVGECRATYCPLLSPKPALCSAELAGLDFGERTRLWGLMQEAIFRRDLGPAAKELVAPLVEALSFLPSVARPKSMDASVESELVMHVGQKMLSVYERSDGEKKPLFVLRAAPTKTSKKPRVDLGPLQNGIQALVSRRWPDVTARPESARSLVLLVDRDVPYGTVVELLDALRPLFPNVTFMVAP